MGSRGRRFLTGAAATAALVAILPALPASAAASTITVDLATSTGALRPRRHRPPLRPRRLRHPVRHVDPAVGADTTGFGTSSSGYAPNIDRIQIAAPLG